jgi:hypothetical protein
MNAFCEGVYLKDISGNLFKRYWLDLDASIQGLADAATVFARANPDFTGGDPTPNELGAMDLADKLILGRKFKAVKTPASYPSGITIQHESRDVDHSAEHVYPWNQQRIFTMTTASLLHRLADVIDQLMQLNFVRPEEFIVATYRYVLTGTQNTLARFEIVVYERLLELYGLGHSVFNPFEASYADNIKAKATELRAARLQEDPAAIRYESDISYDPKPVLDKVIGAGWQLAYNLRWLQGFYRLADQAVNIIALCLSQSSEALGNAYRYQIDASDNNLLLEVAKDLDMAKYGYFIPTLKRVLFMLQPHERAELQQQVANAAAVFSSFPEKPPLAGLHPKDALPPTNDDSALEETIAGQELNDDDDDDDDDDEDDDVVFSRDEIGPFHWYELHDVFEDSRVGLACYSLANDVEAVLPADDAPVVDDGTAIVFDLSGKSNESRRATVSREEARMRSIRRMLRETAVPQLRDHYNVLCGNLLGTRTDAAHDGNAPVHVFRRQRAQAMATIAQTLRLVGLAGKNSIKVAAGGITVDNAFVNVATTAHLPEVDAVLNDVYGRLDAAIGAALTKSGDVPRLFEMSCVVPVPLDTTSQLADYFAGGALEPLVLSADDQKVEFTLYRDDTTAAKELPGLFSVAVVANELVLLAAAVHHDNTRADPDEHIQSVLNTLAHGQWCAGLNLSSLHGVLSPDETTAWQQAMLLGRQQAGTELVQAIVRDEDPWLQKIDDAVERMAANAKTEQKSEQIRAAYEQVGIFTMIVVRVCV